MERVAQDLLDHRRLDNSIAYNPASQITSAPRSNDAYSWNGSVAINRNYTGNGLNQYTAAGTASFTYDARGNLTSDGTNSYSYSSENLLKTAPGATTLSYDPMLRLYQLSGTSGTTKFVYDGLDMIAEYNASNLLQRRYVQGPGDDEPIVEYAGTAPPPGRSFPPTSAEASSRAATASARWSPPTATTNMAYPARAMPGCSNIPGRCG